ncbi:MAG: helix-turn-helix transcriptional regulator [Rariglobus sp.]
MDSFEYPFGKEHDRSVSAQLQWAYHGEPFVEDREWSIFVEVSASIFFVESGSVELEFASDPGRIVTCAVGDLFLGRRSLRRQRIAAGTRLLSIGYDLVWPSGRQVYEAGLDLRIPNALNGDSGVLHRKLMNASRALFKNRHANRTRVDFRDEMRSPHADPVFWVDDQIMFWNWFSCLKPVLSENGINPSLILVARSEVVRKVKDFIDRRALNAPFRGVPTELRSSVSWRRVQQLFHEELQTTAFEYFEARRILHARRRLRMPGTSVKEVASELGFRSLAYFSSWFKRRIGMAPRKFITAYFGP